MLISPGRIGRIGQPAGSTGRVSRLQSLLESLYGNGEEGAFFVPKPQVMGQQVLFQDAAGTTPVTADGDPVGRMLDLSKGGFGEQVNPDPDLSQPELWEDVPAHVQFVDGELVFDTNIDAASIFLPVSIKPGMKYHILMTVEASTSGAGYVTVGLSRNKATSGVNAVGVGIGGGLSSTQVRGGDVEVPSDWPEGDEFYIFVSCSKRDFVYRFSHLTVTELPGNHAIQETSGARPVYRTDGTRHWLEFDGVDDGMTATLPDLGTDATEWWVDESGVTILTGQTIGAGVRGLPEVERLYAYGLLDRALTLQDTNRLTSYLEGLAP